MPPLTRRRDPDRPDAWRIHYGDVRVGSIARAAGNSNATECWQWSCGFYPGAEPREHRHGIAPTFEAARAAFEAAWREFLPKRSEADFQAWRDQQRWTAEKYRRFDRGERMPTEWRQGQQT
jgi:hypothetical protein